MILINEIAAGATWPDRLLSISVLMSCVILGFKLFA